MTRPSCSPSPITTAGANSACKRTPCFWANGCNKSRVSFATRPKSHRSRLAPYPPESKRASVSRDSVSRCIRWAARRHDPIPSRYSPGVRSRASADSASAMMTATGVRSSWDASAVNSVWRSKARLSWSKADCCRSKVVLSTVASWPSSLSVSETLIRSARFPEVIFRAVELISAMGLIARVTTHQPPTNPRMAIPLPTKVISQACRCRSATSPAIERPTTLPMPIGLTMTNSRRSPRIRTEWPE